MTAADSLSGQQFLDLYHNTTPEAAAAIKKSGFDAARADNTRRAYFTTHKNSEYSQGFGDATVHVRVPSHTAELDDEFPTGEQHYAVKTRRIRPEHFMDD